jgi:co-chaperonin GroES (HSP10)
MIWYQGKEYWMVDIQKLFGVIKAENKSIKMLNSYCMLEDVEEEGRIYLPQAAKRITRAKEATLSQIGNSRTDETRYDIFPCDRVLVHPHRIQNYSIGEKKFSIVAQKDIFGRVL